MASEKAPLSQLLSTCKEKYPETLKKDFWYIITVRHHAGPNASKTANGETQASAMITAPQPHAIADLYEYLVNEGGNDTQERRCVINRRLHALLMKLWVVIGIPKVVDAFLVLIAAQKPGDMDPDFTKKYTRLDAAIRPKGVEYLNLVYGEDAVRGMFTTWGGNMEWLIKDVVYGLFFADDGIFDHVESEQINYVGMLCQGLPRPTAAHLGGLKRMGVSAEDTRSITDIANAVLRWCGHDRSDSRLAKNGTC